MKVPKHRQNIRLNKANGNRRLVENKNSQDHETDPFVGNLVEERDLMERRESPESNHDGTVQLPENDGTEGIDEYTNYENESDENDARLEESFASSDDSIDRNLKIDQFEFSKSDHRLLSYCYAFLHMRLSFRNCAQLDSLMLLLCGVQPLFNMSDVRKSLENFETQIIKSVLFSCKTCGFKKSTAKSSCFNYKCSKYRLAVYKGDTSETTSFNILKQVYNVVSTYFGNIHEHHKQMHYGQVPFDQYEFRTSPIYKELMESKERFENNRINILFSIFSDGAILKRHSKKEATTVMMKIENLPSKIKSQDNNTIICSINFCQGGVNQENIGNVFQSSLEEITNAIFHHSVMINGVVEEWEVKLKCVAYLADMKESRNLIGIPNWTNLSGCSVCPTTGRRTNGSNVSFSSLTKFPSRKDEEMMRDCENGRNGFARQGVPLVLNYLKPTQFLLDHFHVLNLGVVRYVLNEVAEHKKWKSAKLKTQRLEALDEASRDYTRPQSSSSNHPALNQRANSTGMELLKLAEVVLPLSAAADDFINPNYGAFMFGWFLILSSIKLDSITAEVHNLMKLLHLLHLELEPNYFPLKFHVSYQHLLGFIEQYGLALSTEAYERVHRKLQMTIHSSATNATKALGVRFIFMGCVNRFFLSSGIKLPGFASHIEEEDDLYESINEESSNILSISKVNEEHVRTIRTLMNNISSPLVFFKRRSITVGKKTIIVASSSYWRTSSTDQSTIMYFSNNKNEFGRIILLFAFRSEIYCLLKKFNIASVEETLVRLVKRLHADSVAMKIISIVSGMPTVFSKILGEEYVILPCRLIVSPAVVLKYERDRYVRKY